MAHFRHMTGIVSADDAPAVQADVIMTAVLLGFTAWRLGDPADAGSTLAPLEPGTRRRRPGHIQSAERYIQFVSKTDKPAAFLRFSLWRSYGQGNISARGESLAAARRTLDLTDHSGR
jgi:hypothetical protein